MFLADTSSRLEHDHIALDDELADITEFSALASDRTGSASNMDQVRHEHLSMPLNFKTDWTQKLVRLSTIDTPPQPKMAIWLMFL